MFVNSLLRNVKHKVLRLLVAKGQYIKAKTECEESPKEIVNLKSAYLVKRGIAFRECLSMSLNSAQLCFREYSRFSISPIGGLLKFPT